MPERDAHGAEGVSLLAADARRMDELLSIVERRGAVSKQRFIVEV